MYASKYEWLKQTVVDITEVCDSVKVRRKKPKEQWSNQDIKAAIERKEVEWKNVVGARDETVKEKCMKIYKMAKGRI